MTDKKISELDAITGSNTAATDVFVVVDTSTGQTKKITREELNNAIEQDVLSSIDIDTINGDFSVNGNINLGDNNKAIFGAGSDLQIYHDGSNSYIVDNGTGDLLIRAENNLFLKRTNSDETYFSGAVNGAVTLFHNNNAKIATTISGVDVTGTVTADGLTVNDVFSFDNSGFNGEIKTYGSGTGIIYDALNGYHTFRENGTARMQIRAGGDIYLGYEDTGTTPKLFWDASAERLGLGTTSPSATLDLVLPSPAASASSGGIEITEGTKTFALSTTGSSYNYAGVGANELWYYGNSNFGAFTFGSDGAVPIKFISNGSERARLDSSGNFMVGGTISNPAFSNTSGAISLRGVVGTIEASRDAGSALELNRKTDDGAIINLRKDGTTVGVIGTQNWGIGTSSPDATLQVVASSTNSEYARFSSTDSRHLRFSSFDTASADAGHDINASSSNGVVTISTGSTERMRITSAGLVGLFNESSPTANLHITGEAQSDFGAGLRLQINNNNSTDNLGTISFANNVNDDCAIIRGFTSGGNQLGGLLFATRNGSSTAEVARLDSSGNLLVGTTNADVANSASVEGIAIRGGSNFLGIARSSASVAKFNRQSNNGAIVAFAKDGTTVGVIGTQNWGIGTSSPAFNNGGGLHIHAGAITNLHLTSTATGSAATDGSELLVGSDSNLYVRNRENAATVFLTNNTERMRIDSSGRSLFRTSTTQNSSVVVTPDTNRGTIMHVASDSIASVGSAKMMEGAYTVVGNSSNTVLSIPVSSQSGSWKSFFIELNFVTGEYNKSGGTKAGYCKLSLHSLTTLGSLTQHEVGGNVSSVSSSGMNILINFTSGYVNGLSDKEGVLVYAKVLSGNPDYIQLDNATFN